MEKLHTVLHMTYEGQSSVVDIQDLKTDATELNLSSRVLGLQCCARHWGCRDEQALCPPAWTRSCKSREPHVKVMNQLGGNQPILSPCSSDSGYLPRPCGCTVCNVHPLAERLAEIRVSVSWSLK